MLRVLREPRWLVLIISVPIGVVLCLMLSSWQRDRWEGRKTANHIQAENMAKPIAPVTEVVGAGAAVSDTSRWRTVTASGTYDVSSQLLIRKKPMQGSNGFWVATPLTLADGKVVFVNRGWVKAGETANSTPAVPPPPTGPVTITGRVQPASSDRALTPDMPAGQAAAINPEQLLPSVATLPAYLDLIESTPPQQPGLTPIPAPEISEGPHLSYSLQWIAFAILFIVGFALLVRREIRLKRDDSTHAGESTTPTDEPKRSPQDSVRG